MANVPGQIHGLVLAVGLSYISYYQIEQSPAKFSQMLLMFSAEIVVPQSAGEIGLSYLPVQQGGVFELGY